MSAETVNENDRIMDEWHELFSVMLADYKAQFPDDERQDKEILEDICDHFVKSGLIKKNEDGKFLVGRIISSPDQD